MTMKQMKIFTTILMMMFLSAFAMGQCDFSDEQKVIASDGTVDDYFGQSVSVSGDRAIVGATDPTIDATPVGAAYVYEWDGTNWAEAAKLTASDGETGDLFGISVSISGDRLIVGTRYYLGGGGAAYIYEWDGTSWVETKLTASDDSGTFGASVSISGDRVVVGDPTNPEDGVSAGAVYIYEWDGTSWVETKLLASDGAPLNGFGSSVSVSGNRIIAGSIFDDVNGTNSGSAYIYEWDGASWVETKLTASDGASNDNFGYSVSISGDRAVVSSILDSDNGFASGSVYIFEWNGTNWVETAKLTAYDAAETDFFGESVSILNDRIIVGSKADDDNGDGSGSAYIYEWNGASWVEETTKLIASDGAAGDSFGTSVAISDEHVIVGAREDADNGVDSGSAYFYGCTPLSINKIERNKILIFPNPVQGHFQIDTELPIQEVTVYNSLGETVAKYHSQETYDVTDLEQGVYIVSIKSNNKKINRKLLID